MNKDVLKYLESYEANRRAREHRALMIVVAFFGLVTSAVLVIWAVMS